MEPNIESVSFAMTFFSHQMVRSCVLNVESLQGRGKKMRITSYTIEKRKDMMQKEITKHCKCCGKYFEPEQVLAICPDCRTKTKQKRLEYISFFNFQKEGNFDSE